MDFLGGLKYRAGEFIQVSKATNVEMILEGSMVLESWRLNLMESDTWWLKV